jgi:cyclopropane-fatty-acyl-phospholipid synthase
MGRHFFTGGLMPSEFMLRNFDRSLVEVERWKWNGGHYQRTAEAWLRNLNAGREVVLPALESAYGRAIGVRWFHRWRMFFLSVAELFGFAKGEEWFVAQVLFARKDSRRNGTS